MRGQNGRKVRLGGLTTEQRQKWKQTVKEEVNQTTSYKETMRNLQQKAQNLEVDRPYA